MTSHTLVVAVHIGPAGAVNSDDIIRAIEAVPGVDGAEGVDMFPRYARVTRAVLVRVLVPAVGKATRIVEPNGDH